MTKSSLTKYSIVYEVDVNPTPVTVEVVCKDLEELESVYESRRDNGQLKKVRKKIKEEPDQEC